MKKITGVYVNADSAKPVEIENSLEGFYSLLDVGCIDIVCRKIGGEYYDIVCDDEALLKADPHVTMIDPQFRPLLYGNLFICRYDGAGNEKSLTKADVKRILKEYKTFLSNRGMVSVLVGDL